MSIPISGISIGSGNLIIGSYWERVSVGADDGTINPFPSLGSHFLWLATGLPQMPI
jgi:hypothetical protein